MPFQVVLKLSSTGRIKIQIFKTLSFSEDSNDWRESLSLQSCRNWRLDNQVNSCRASILGMDYVLDLKLK